MRHLQNYLQSSFVSSFSERIFMGFESGSITFRMFYVPKGLPKDSVERFAALTPPSLDSLGDGSITGWVTSRHLLDSNIIDETAYVAGYLRLTLLKAERKIPPALLRAECKMEELAEMAATGHTYLKRSVKSEIKQSVIERLLPEMPPTLTGIHFVYDARNELLFADASTDKQIDALTIMFNRATGVTIVPVTPLTAAFSRKSIDVRDIPATSFSQDCADADAGDNIGHDFLTWLWFFSEARGGIMNIDGIDFAVMIDGPLTFIHEGNGAHETIVRKGTPLVSAEAKTALNCGKKLRRAKVTLARGEELWSVTMDADDFMMRGLKVPKGEAIDPIGKFEERTLMLKLFQDTFLTFFDRFLDERADVSKWESTIKEIRTWVAEREGRL